MERIEIIVSIIAAVVTTFIAIVGAVWAMLKYGFRFEDIKNDISELKRGLEDLKNKVGNIDLRLTRVETKLERLPIIEAAIDKIPKIEAQVEAHDKDIDCVTERLETIIMKKSPRQLTPFALELFKDIKGEEFITSNKALLYDYIDNTAPKTAYDVERAAFAACWKNTNLDIFNELKLFVYNAPIRTATKEDGKEEKVEITLEAVCATLAIPLRDMYLKEHPEIPQ